MKRAAILLLLVAMSGCLIDAIEDGEDEPIGSGSTALTDGSPAARAILTLVNDGAVVAEDLQAGVLPISDRVATAIFEERPYATLAALDEVPFVGPRVADELYERARVFGLVAEEATLVASWRFAFEDRTVPCRPGIEEVLVEVRELTSDGDSTPLRETAQSCAPGMALLALRGGRYLVRIAGSDRAVVDLTTGAGRVDVVIR